MIPSIEEALKELNIAYNLNPGPWKDHSLNVAIAASLIASKSNLDKDKAYIFGLLHDIGRREGIYQMKHLLDGYKYSISKGWDKVAKICITHSFPIKDVTKDIAKIDITDEEYKFIGDYLNKIEYDDYDKLIILCDALATSDGLCTLEKRFVDVTIRYGFHDSTIERWKKVIEYKEYFESKMNYKIYDLFIKCNDTKFIF